MPKTLYQPRHRRASCPPPVAPVFPDPDPDLALAAVFLNMVSAMAPAIPGCEELAGHPDLVTAT